MAADTPRRKQELIGVFWGFFSLFLFASLFSYSPKDPCLFIRGGATGPVENWMGPAGATISGWLFLAFGFGGWLIPLGMAVYAWRQFRGESSILELGKVRLGLKVFGSLLLLLSVSVFLSLVFHKVELGSEFVLAGGLLGEGLASPLSRFSGRWGALFLDGLIILVALFAAVDFSLLRAVRKTIALGSRVAIWVKERKAKREAARQRRKQVEKDRELMERSRTRPEIKIVTEPKEKEKEKAKPRAKPRQPKLPFVKDQEFELPALDLLDEPSTSKRKVDPDLLLMNARLLEKKLRDFGVSGEVVEVQPGPVITMYEFRPGPGIKINKIVNLADDLAMALSAVSVRIIAPIPGKDVVGIEISNREREVVFLRELIESEAFAKVRSPLPMALGKDITGKPFCFDLKKAPHLLVAGATGSGKSVCLNALIMSVLYRSSPLEVQMLMIDPKKLELSVYEGIPHLLHRVIADPKDAALALKWAVAEMERRYSVLAEQGVRNIDAYNRLALKARQGKAGRRERAEQSEPGDTLVVPEKKADQKEAAPPEKPLPFILVVIDELADLMMVAARDIEDSICRLAQMARAAGIHLIVATQRPSVDVITGLIKANFPARIGFKVASKTDSRTILDQNGAERLLGQGDMLFIPPGTSEVIRLHGAFVSDDEIKRVTQFWREQGEPSYDEEIIRPRAEDQAGEGEPVDEKWEEALRLVATTRQASVSMLQRKLKIGYNRAARIIEEMEAKGLVGPSDGVKPREVLIDPYQLDRQAG